MTTRMSKRANSQRQLKKPRMPRLCGPRAVLHTLIQQPPADGIWKVAMMGSSTQNPEPCAPTNTSACIVSGPFDYSGARNYLCCARKIEPTFSECSCTSSNFLVKPPAPSTLHPKLKNLTPRNFSFGLIIRFRVWDPPTQ